MTLPTGCHYCVSNTAVSAGSVSPLIQEHHTPNMLQGQSLLPESGSGLNSIPSLYNVWYTSKNDTSK